MKKVTIAIAGGINEHAQTLKELAKEQGAEVLLITGQGITDDLGSLKREALKDIEPTKNPIYDDLRTGRENRRERRKNERRGKNRF